MKPNGKTPLTAHGCKDASKKLKKIRKWWSEWPDANVGITTGAISALVVLDFDVKNGAKGTPVILRARDNRVQGT